MLKDILPKDRAQIPAEIIAGITLTCLAIPEVMGYTKISGTPVITGLYTMLLPPLLYVIFGSSRHLVVGADSATAAIMAAGLAAMSVTDPADYLALASVSAIMAAILLVLARVFKMGFLADFLSRSVLIGFLTGVGIQVAAGEFPALFGVHPDGHDIIAKFRYFFANLDQINGLTILLAIISFAAIFGAEKISKKLPGALILVILSLLVSWLFGFSERGIKTLGPLPMGLPDIGLPKMDMDIQKFIDLAPIACSMFVVILAQSAATSRAYANRYDESYNADVDLVGLAAANIGAALSGTFVVNGSPTKTEMLDSAGGRTQVAQLVSVGLVLLVLLFLTRPLAYMPEIILTVIVFLIGIKLVDIRGMKELFIQARTEFWVASMTALTVVFAGVKDGILMAVVLSIIDHLSRSYRPKNYVITPGSKRGWSYTDMKEAQEFLPGLIIYHFTHSIYYANVQAFAEEVTELEKRFGSRLKWLCLEGSAINDIDYSGAKQIQILANKLRNKGVQIVSCNFSPNVMSQIERYGLVDRLGRDWFFQYPADMLEAYTTFSGTPSEEHI